MSDIPSVPRSRGRRADAGPPPPPKATAAPAGDEAHRFPCPTCGSDLRFSAAEGTLVCDHCGRVERVSAIGRQEWVEALRELDYDRAIKNDLPAGDMVTVRTLHCESCGAQIELNDGEHATECPFCASPVVTDTGASRQFKPSALLPFAIDEATAHKAMTDWLGRLWFAPNGLRQYARKGRRMKGIYVPYWTYDARTRTAYAGRRGDNYVETHMRVMNGRPQPVQVVRTRWRSVRGKVARNFDDVLVLASDTLPREYTDDLAPWDLRELIPYRPEYLAGFVSEGYSVPLESGFSIARAKMDAVIAGDIRRDIGGDLQQITNARTDLSDVTFKHILLPIWLAAYKYRGRSYRFVVNARTGRIKGERPYSAVKITLAILAALIVAGIAFYLYQAQNGGGFTPYPGTY
ncbi:TFIIB-type zinc finger domain-containing protein [Tropicimonas sp. IMCC34043]|uniref:TFIIB-type zinc finger domain-containing protein n=1 Tax=Tropicimonas sp. IMCC34043 TaxID=2248760 RepID=UPI000E26D24F|nr:TFIIB-type zinc finger domain-containing protein [Tropicimonas sp. IMCC34043]